MTRRCRPEELLERVTAHDTAWAAEEQLMKTGIGMRVGEVDWNRNDIHDR